MPGRNSVPLEKVLLPMDLSKGLDERSRPEVGGEQSKLLTTLENLVQEQDGAWVKRPGLNSLAADLTVDPIIRMLRTQSGMAIIDSRGSLHHYYPNNSEFVKKGPVSEFKVTGHFVASTQTNTTYRVLANAANDQFECVVTEGSYSTTGSRTAILNVYDKGSGQLYARHDLGVLCSATASHTPQVKIGFIGSNILHIWMWANNSLGSPLTFVQFDVTDRSGPAGATTIAAGNTSPITDFCVFEPFGGNQAGSCITYGTTARTMDALGVTVTRTAGGHFYQSVDTDHFGNLYLFSADFATSSARIDVVSASNIAGAASRSFVDGALAFTGGTPGIAYDLISDKIYLAYEDTLTGFPRVRVWSCGTAATSFTLQGTIFGWRLLSTPFVAYDANNSWRCYVHLCKDETGVSVQNPVGCHVVACISEIASPNYSATTNTASVFRVAACLEPYVALRNTQTATYSPGNPSASTTWPRQRYFWQSSGFKEKINIAIPIQTTVRSAGFVSYTLSLRDPANYSSHSFGPLTVIAGGSTGVYDGKMAGEAGFFDYPMFSVADSGVAGNPNGSYNYVALFRKIDAYGQVHYSRAFGPVSLTVASKKVTVTVQACHVTNKENSNAGLSFSASGDAQVIVELYRTQSGGTQYYLCSSSALPAASAQSLTKGANFYTCTDDMSDATLASQAQLFRQPGTAGTALDRYPGPGGTVSCQHKDRSFVADPTGLRVYYSSFFVDGEGPWFNAALNLQFHGGNGPVTAMMSMDGRLFVFKRDAIFVVDGDGPPENGGTGAEFSPPTRITTEYGCIDQRSMVLTPDGIMYRSPRGIEILTRSLQVKWVGDRVQNTIASYPVTKSAVLDDFGRVHFMVASNGELAVEDYAASGGRELVYDTTSDCWSTGKYWADGTYGNVPQTGVVGEAVIAANGQFSERRLMYAAGLKTYYVRDESGYDAGHYVPWTVETGWLRPTGTQGRFRFQDALFLGKRNEDHNLTMSLAYDYRAYEQSRQWQYPSLTETLEELNLQPKITQPVTFKLKIEETAPTSTPSNAKGVDLLGICFVVSPKAGAQQVAEYKKG